LESFVVAFVFTGRGGGVFVRVHVCDP
jgi:hypothetical protein